MSDGSEQLIPFGDHTYITKDALTRALDDYKQQHGADPGISIEFFHHGVPLTTRPARRTARRAHKQKIKR